MTITQKLEKCKRSIEAHIGRGGGLNSNRGYELCDRYNALRWDLREQDWKGWVRYCKSHGMHISHSGHDFFE